MEKIKILVLGDTHLRTRNIEYRSDNIESVVNNKIEQIKDISKNIDYIVHLGDWLHFGEDKYRLLHNVLKNLIKPCFTCIGNHDFNGKEKSGKIITDGTFLGILLEKGIVKNQEEKIISLGNKNLYLKFLNYGDYEKVNNGLFKKEKNDFSIAFYHGSVITDEKIKIDNPYVYKNIKTDYDYFISGHYHFPFEIKNKNTTFINPGSILRLTTLEKDWNRIPKVLILEIDKNGIKHNYIELKTEKCPFIFDKKENKKKLEDFYNNLNINFISITETEEVLNCIDLVGEKMNMEKEFLENLKLEVKNISF